jgi:TonB family protein
MKIHFFAAALALTPGILFAQANVPAQSAVLQARVSAPAGLKAAMGEAAPTATPTAIRVSTGVVAPRLLNPLTLQDVAGAHNRLAANDITVAVNMTVDATGKPTDIAIAQSAGEGVDKEVLALVNQYRFQPGTLDGQPFAIPVHLQVILPRGTQY